MCTVPQSLSQEQIDRLEKNKMAALAKRAARLGVSVASLGQYFALAIARQFACPDDIYAIFHDFNKFPYIIDHHIY